MYWEAETRAEVKGRDILGQFYDWLSILTDSFFIGSEIQRFKHDSTCKILPDNHKCLSL